MLEAVQKCQSKLLRALNGSRVSDQISTKSLLLKFNILSVNQMNAQIKLSEMWKSVNIANYPIKTVKVESQAEGINTRAKFSGLLKELKVTNKNEKTFGIWHLVKSRNAPPFLAQRQPLKHLWHLCQFKKLIQK